MTRRVIARSGATKQSHQGFTSMRLLRTTRNENASASPRILDLRRVLCPMNYLKARMALEAAADSKSIFEILLDDEEGIRDVPGSLRADGYSVLSSWMEKGIFHLVVES